MPPGRIQDVRRIDDRWNDEMLAIVQRSPMNTSGMEIVFDHRPNIFQLPRLRSRELKCAGLFVRDELRGFAMMLTKDVLVEGSARPVLYFCNLCVDPSARGRGFLYQASDVLLGSPSDRAMLGHGLIFEGNEAAMSLLNRFHPRYPNMPHSRILGQWKVHTILLTPHLRPRPAFLVRRARMDDLDAIVHLLQAEYSTRLFAPVVTRETIQDELGSLPNLRLQDYFVAESRGEILGVCCAWDMTPVKRNRVLRYGRNFRGLRFLYRGLAPLVNLPSLPSESGAFRDVTITDYAVRDRDPAILRGLLAHICRVYRRKKYHMLLFGCGALDPLSSAANGFLSRAMVSNIVAFSRSTSSIGNLQEQPNPWIDMALL